MNNKVIAVRDLEPGMKIVFKDSRYSFIVDEVTFTRDGEWKVDHSNFTGVDFYEVDDQVMIQVD